MELNVHVNLLKPNNIESRNGCNGSGKLGLGGDLGGGGRQTGIFGFSADIFNIQERLIFTP